MRTTLFSSRVLFDRKLVLAGDHLVVFGNRGHAWPFGTILHDFIAGGLELLQKLRQRLGGVVLEIVHEDDALAALFQLTHYRLNHLLGLVYLEIQRRSMSVEKIPILRCARYSSSCGRVLQVGETEEWRHHCLRRPDYCADAHFDFLLRQIDILAHKVAR